MKNSQVFKLLLMIAPLQCFDFIPNWLIAFYCFSLFIGIFINILEWISFPIIFGLSYVLIKEFGYNLQPESAVGFLNLILLIKFLSPRAKKHTQYLLGFLWIGTFALFNTNIYYLIYLFLSMVFIIYMYPHPLQDKFSFKNISIDKKFILSLLKALPLIIILFLVFPRLYGFLPSANKSIAGKIGYSTKINNSTINNLQLNAQIAFYAEMKELIPIEQLYWRGRIHTHTDGYNWRGKDEYIARNKVKISQKGSAIKYLLKYEQDFNGDIILLDTPVTILDSSLRYYEQKKYKTFRTYQKKKKLNLNALSKLNSKIIQTVKKGDYLQLPKFIPQSLKNINAKIKSKNPSELIKKFKQYLIKENYSYSLSPGRLSTMNDFINKKIGYCTHYASLLGVLLRLNGIPTRLVSGFQGAEYNNIGQYYIIRSNDAHAWVEYHTEGSWNRVDPTEFISPQRILRGGENFLNQGSQIVSHSQLSSSLSFIKKYFDSINYKLSLFMDSFDRESQSEIAKIFKLSLKQFYFLGALLLFIASFILIIRKRNRKETQRDEIDKLFLKFEKKLAKKGHLIKAHHTISKCIKELDENEIQESYVLFLKQYQITRYSHNKDVQKLKDLYQKLN